MRRIHVLIGLAAVVLSAVHIALAPQRWMLGAIVLLPGLWMAWRRLPSLAAATLALVSLWELARYQTAFPAVFLGLAVLDGAGLAIANRCWVKLGAFVALAGASVWLGIIVMNEMPEP